MPKPENCKQLTKVKQCSHSKKKKKKTDWCVLVYVMSDLYSQAKRKKKEEAANAKILEAEKRIKVI